jgi:ATP-dependent DNA helicase RecG
VLVVGVDDKAVGPDAFVQTYLDLAWLRRRIYELTVPNLSLDHIEELVVEGKRIYMLNVADALEEIRCDGKLRARIGRSCEELTGDRARQLLESRRKYDWSAEPSGKRLSDVDPRTLKLGCELYARAHDRELAVETHLFAALGLVTEQGADSQLNNAGALLFCAFEPNLVRINLRAARSAGAASYERIEYRSPLLDALVSAYAKLDQLFVPEAAITGLQRRERRVVPGRAYREALVNAAMHCDYRQTNGHVVVTVLGDPAATLRVHSPGGFLPGVSASRLLSVPSRPRNPVLANALRTLRLAEREGTGVDRMYVEMLRDGHPAPEIVEDGGDVLCNLFGGTPDTPIREFFDAIAERDRALLEDAIAHIALTKLFQRATLRPEELVGDAQCTSGEAIRILERIEAIGAIERVVSRGTTFRLTDESKDRLRGRLSYTPRAQLDEHWDLLRAYFDSHAEIGRGDLSILLGVTSSRAAGILGELHHARGVIVPVRNSRGPGVRYRLADRA